MLVYDTDLKVCSSTNWSSLSRWTSFSLHQSDRSLTWRRTLDDEDDEEEEQLTSTPREPASRRPRFYDPFSSDPTPLALRRTRRKN